MTSGIPAALANDEPLARHTTLELGGPARHFIIARDEVAIMNALRFADQRGLAILPLGGGSNMVIADAGFAGVVLAIANRGVHFTDEGDSVRVVAAAGESWDALVAETVVRGLAGLECLSGIPGTVGATPIQNVGAYGQEVAQTIIQVVVIDRESRSAEARRILMPEECEFRYRDSLFRRFPARFVVTEVHFLLRRGAPAPLRHGELAGRLAALPVPSLADVRAAVLALRRIKSMVLDPGDENRRSVGSFFTNPTLTEAQADDVRSRVLANEVGATSETVPVHPAGPGRVKISAAWLIEHAGFLKGLRRGAVGISSRHALALVHHGGGTTAELLGLAREIRDGVAARFGVMLVPEPVLIGLGW